MQVHQLPCSSCRHGTSAMPWDQAHAPCTLLTCGPLLCLWPCRCGWRRAPHWQHGCTTSSSTCGLMHIKAAHAHNMASSICRTGTQVTSLWHGSRCHNSYSSNEYATGCLVPVRTVAVTTAQQDDTARILHHHSAAHKRCRHVMLSCVRSAQTTTYLRPNHTLWQLVLRYGCGCTVYSAACQADMKILPCITVLTRGFALQVTGVVMQVKRSNLGVKQWLCMPARVQ